ncbi:MAG: DUF72 domain-containing protein [Candidatus Thiodiazotropha sp.]
MEQPKFPFHGEFCHSAQLLENRLGLLLQLPPDLPYQPQLLDAAFHAFTTASLVAVEFRNEHWLTEEIFSLLRKRKANYCNPDHPQQPLSTIVTGDTGYLRLHGQRHWYTDNYSRDELIAVAETARKIKQQGLKEIYIFFNNDYGAHAPHNAAELLQLV